MSVKRLRTQTGLTGHDLGIGQAHALRHIARHVSSDQYAEDISALKIVLLDPPTMVVAHSPLLFFYEFASDAVHGFKVTSFNFIIDG